MAVAPSKLKAFSVMKPSCSTPGKMAWATATASGPCRAKRPPVSARSSLAVSPAADAMRAKSASLQPALTTM